MSRFKGHALLNTTYDVNYWGPLDSRWLVPNIADLYKEETWKTDLASSETNAYNGMIVAVANDEDGLIGIFCLRDVENLTETDSWIELAVKSNNDSSDAIKLEVIREGNLPIPGKNNTLYLVLNTSPREKNRYLEYLYIDNDYELIGSISSSGSDEGDYYTKPEIDTFVNNLNSRTDYLDSEIQKVVGGLTAVNNKISDIDNVISGIQIKQSDLESSLESKVTRKYTDGEEWDLLSPEDKKKLAALTLNGGNLEVSGTVKAENVSDLDKWITDNRDKDIAGLLSSSQEEAIISNTARLNVIYPDNQGIPISLLKQNDETIILQA